MYLLCETFIEYRYRKCIIDTIDRVHHHRYTFCKLDKKIVLSLACSFTLDFTAMVYNFAKMF